MLLDWLLLAGLAGFGLSLISTLLTKKALTCYNAASQTETRPRAISKN